MSFKLNPVTQQVEFVDDSVIPGLKFDSNNTFDSSKYTYNTPTADTTISNPTDGLGYNSVLYKDTTKEPGMFDWLGSDNMKGIGTLGGLAMSGLGIWNTMNAQDQAKKQWAAENDRANKVMAMNTERYNQWKADRDSLKAQYSPGTKV